MLQRCRLALCCFTSLLIFAAALSFAPFIPEAAAQATDDGFIATTPCAVLDTRFGSDFGDRIDGGTTITAQISDAISTGQITADCAQAGVVPAGTTAVMVNVVAVAPVADGNLRISAAGTSAQGGVVNFGPGTDGPGTNSNAVPVALSDTGHVDIFVNSQFSAATHVRLVILGFYGPGGDKFVPTNPCAVLDTRDGLDYGEPIDGGTTLTAQMLGEIPLGQTLGIPCFDPLSAGATGVMVNVVAVNPSATGNLRISAAGTTAEGGVVNFGPGTNGPGTNSNAVPVALSDTGHVDIFVNSTFTGATHVRLVVLGYFASTGTTFVPTTPCAIFDSRVGTSFASPLVGGSTTTVQATGEVPTSQIFADCAQDGVVPTGARAVMVNAVAVTPTSPGNLRIAATGGSPEGGVVNFGPGNNGAGTNSNAVPVALSNAGQLDVFVNAPRSVAASHLRLVVVGYFLGTDSAAVEGTITTDGDVPAATVRVCARNVATFVVTCEDAAPDGTYVLALPPGDYIVWAFDVAGDYAIRIYNPSLPNHATLFNDARELFLNPDATWQVDLDLELGGRITGFVEDEAELPVEGVEVCIYVAESGDFRGCFPTDAGGIYEAANLPAGDFAVLFFADPQSSLVSEWFENSNSFANRTDVVVTAGGTAIANSQLGLGGQIAGTVTNDAGQPLQFIEACATSPDFRWCARTDASGEYLLGGLPFGTYEVRFEDPDNVYALEYYDDTYTIFDQAPIDVSVDRVGGIDAQMTQGTVGFTGRVFDHAGNLAEGIEVCPVSTEHDIVACGLTGSDGRYLIDGLPVSDYRVRFLDRSGFLATEYFDDTPSFNRAEILSPTAGMVVERVDASLDRGASIAGTVTRLGGAPFAGVDVCATSEDFALTSCTRSAADGSYELSGLPAPQQYFVEFIDPSGRKAREFYEETFLFQNRTTLPLLPGQRQSGIDARLDGIGISVEGTVTDAATRAAVPDILVCAQAAATEFTSCVTTGADGTYRFVGLPSFLYRIQFSAWNGEDFGSTYATEYYRNAFFGNATILSLVDTVHTGIDAALERSGKIAGTVRSDGGTSLRDIRVCAGRVTVDHVFCDFTDAAGRYEITGLAAGQHWLVFEDLSGRFFGEFFNNAFTINAAQRLNVNPGSTIQASARLTPNPNAAAIAQASRLAPIDGLVNPNVLAPSPGPSFTPEPPPPSFDVPSIEVEVFVEPEVRRSLYETQNYLGDD